jgi:multidrug efflux pump subunit AcrB
MIFGVISTGTSIVIVNMEYGTNMSVVQQDLQAAFISQPLAIVVIGSLISSTLLTLVLVPVLYAILKRANRRSATRRAGGSTCVFHDTVWPDFSRHRRSSRLWS